MKFLKINARRLQLSHWLSIPACRTDRLHKLFRPENFRDKSQNLHPCPIWRSVRRDLDNQALTFVFFE